MINLINNLAKELEVNHELYTLHSPSKGEVVCLFRADQPPTHFRVIITESGYIFDNLKMVEVADEIFQSVVTNSEKYENINELEFVIAGILAVHNKEIFDAYIQGSGSSAPVG